MTKHVRFVKLPKTERCSIDRWAPFDSLTSRLGLHSVVYRNARAVALLWGHFVQAMRLRYWENLKRIPLFPQGIQKSQRTQPFC